MSFVGQSVRQSLLTDVLGPLHLDRPIGCRGAGMILRTAEVEHGVVLSLGNDLSFAVRVNPYGAVGGSEGQPTLHCGAQIESDGTVAGTRVDRAGPFRSERNSNRTV